MVLKSILGYFLQKRKTRLSPYFIGVCELFATTLLIFFTTATWIKKLVCLAPLGFTKALFFLLFFIWLHAISLGFYGKLYLKLYLKLDYCNFLQLFNIIFYSSDERTYIHTSYLLTFPVTPSFIGCEDRR